MRHHSFSKKLPPARGRTYRAVADSISGGMPCLIPLTGIFEYIDTTGKKTPLPHVHEESMDTTPKPEEAAKNTVFLILGMHRSGTSLCARTASLLGAGLSDDMLAPRADNPHGYFEDRRVVTINAEILRHVFAPLVQDAYPLAVQMCPWPLPADWLHDEKIRALRQQALEYVATQTAAVRHWCLKDPRICRTLPFWLDIFSELGLAVRCILSIRHPAHVAASLAARDGFLPDQVELQWLMHVLDAVFHAPDLDAVIEYEDWFGNAPATLARMAAALGLRPEKNAMAAALANIDREANHAPLTPEIRHPFARTVYDVLLAARTRPGPVWPQVQDNSPRNALLRMRNSLLDAFALLPGCYAEAAFAATRQRQSKKQYEEALAAQHAVNDRLSASLERFLKRTE